VVVEFGVGKDVLNLWVVQGGAVSWMVRQGRRWDNSG